jgi:hypothetical protein
MEAQFLERNFTPLENPSIYAGDSGYRRHQLLIPAYRQAGRGQGQSPDLSKGIYSSMRLMSLMPV